MKWLLSSFSSFDSSASGAASNTATSSGIYYSMARLVVATVIAIIPLILLVLLQACFLEVSVTMAVVTYFLSFAVVLLINDWPSQLMFTDQKGSRFVEMVRNSEYGQRHLCLYFQKLLNTPGKYQVYLLKGGQTGLHWSLLVRMTGARIALPFLSIEVNTDANLNDLIPTMRRFMELPKAAELQGCINGKSIMKLCKIADNVRSEMGSYSLTSTNCQYFCNKILEKLNLNTHVTTTEGIINTATNVVVAATNVAVAATAISAVVSMCNVM